MLVHSELRNKIYFCIYFYLYIYETVEKIEFINKLIQKN